MTCRLRLLISSGPTREPLDPVRFVSNYSTGTMGACLAREALRRGHRVTMVSGPTELLPPRGARVIRVERTREMQQALRREMPRTDVLIMAAAVSDFEPARASRQKLPRRGTLRLALRATPDVVGSLPRRRGQLVVGFALESAEGVARAKQKLKAKRLDLVVGQQMNGTSPFGPNQVKAFFVNAAGMVTRLGKVSKPRLARVLLDEIEQLWYGGVRLNEEVCPTC